MARDITTITNDIKTKIRTYPSLNAFKFPEEGGSRVGVFNLLIDTAALCVFTFEVLMDQLKADIQAIADTAPAGNNKWIQTRMFEFQYGNVIALVNGSPVYNPVIVANRIITQCAVKDIGNGIVAIKLAKGTTAPFSPLSAPELAAVKNYYYGTATTEGIGFSGVKAQFITLSPDRMYLSANLYFFGQYIQSTVKTNVIAAIDAFLKGFANEAFGGRVFMIKLVDAIQAVDGVSRVELLSVKGRPSSVTLTFSTTIPLQGFYDTVAGHIISEDTALNTLDDTITMIEEVA